MHGVLCSFACQNPVIYKGKQSDSGCWSWSGVAWRWTNDRSRQPLEGAHWHVFRCSEFNSLLTGVHSCHDTHTYTHIREGQCRSQCTPFASTVWSYHAHRHTHIYTHAGTRVGYHCTYIVLLYWHPQMMRTGRIRKEGRK